MKLSVRYLYMVQCPPADWASVTVTVHTVHRRRTLVYFRGSVVPRNAVTPIVVPTPARRKLAR
jgi:hypothetical protein